MKHHLCLVKKRTSEEDEHKKKQILMEENRSKLVEFELLKQDRSGADRCRKRLTKKSKNSIEKHRK